MRRGKGAARRCGGEGGGAQGRRGKEAARRCAEEGGRCGEEGEKEKGRRWRGVRPFGREKWRGCVAAWAVGSGGVLGLGFVFLFSFFNPTDMWAKLTSRALNEKNKHGNTLSVSRQRKIGPRQTELRRAK